MVYRHVRRRGDRSTPHPTREKLLNTAVELLGEVGFEGFVVDDLLTRAGVTSGALYHHFADVPDLLEHAMARRFPIGVLESVTQLREALSRCSTLEEYQAAMREVTAVSQNPSNRARRMERAHIIALALESDSLRQVIAAQQREITEAYIEVLGEIQSRGWLRSDLDPRAVATFLQAYTLGRIVDDINEEHLDPEAWNNLINTVMLEALSGPGDH